MATAKSHHTDRHEFRGEHIGAPVADFLNRSFGTSEYKRIVQLIGMLQNAAKDSRVLQQLKWRLSRYPVRPMPSVTGGHLRVTWVAYKNAAEDECAAAHKVIQLWEMGLLEALAQCECKHPSGGNWFFVRFAHQRFCSSECRIRHNASSEEAKKYRREWMRENYSYKKSHPGKGKRHGRV